MHTTPSAGIHAINFAHAAHDVCHECGKQQQPRTFYPKPRAHEWRCTNRACGQFAFPSEPVRVPSVSQLGWL